jgi:hypothetical protein
MVLFQDKVKLLVIIFGINGAYVLRLNPKYLLILKIMFKQFYFEV